MALRCVVAADGAVPLARIAAEAGVSEALVHHYFPNREALRLAVATRAGSFAQGFLDAFSQPDAEERVVAAFVDLSGPEREALSWLHGEARCPGALGEAVRAADTSAAALVAQWLSEHGVAKPEIRAVGFLGGLFQFLVGHARLPDEEWADRARPFAHGWVGVCLAGGSR